jgi:magnesium transporter
MVIAGFAGALTPIVLRRLGQDPATSSSIILTTITEIVGFLSFLGIAAAMIEYL